MDIDNLSSPFGSISISVPERVTDIDDHDDLFFSPEYAQDIIDYMQVNISSIVGIVSLLKLADCGA